MTLSDDLITGGLTLGHDLMFSQCPADPDMRESTSMWLYDETGRFALPRIGIEAEASRWDTHRVQGNIAFAGGRVLNGAGMGAAHSPFGLDGRPTVLGAGPLACTCIETFRKWRVQWEGPAVDGTVDQQIAKTIEPTVRVPVHFDLKLTMAAPAWVQDNSPEKLAKMSEADAREAGNMGIGWRFEQLLRAEGTLTVDGETHAFKGTGLRVKRQSVRPMTGFAGHCWQSAIFPDGRGFGYIAYPTREDGYQFNEAFIWQDGKMYDAKVTKIPWLRRIVSEGDDCSVELELELGTTRIAAISALNTFRVGNPDIGGLNLNQGGAKFTWNGQTAYGMMERSSHESLTTID